MATKAMDAAAGALSGFRETKPKKLSVREIAVRKGHAGGFIAKHRLEDAEGYEHGKSPEYPMVSMADLHKHLEEHLGEEAAEVADKKKE